jgi:DNA end-binding protein Ku
LPEAAAPSSFWSGTISFGLVTIPVSLYAATRGSVGASLRSLAPDGTPLRREYMCPKHDRALESDEIVRAYELEDGELVAVTDEELDALAPEASHEIALQRFVDKAELSPLLFDRPYFLLPSSGSTKPYRLLVQVLEAGGRAGIATFVMRGHQHVVAILAEDQLLRAQTLRFVSQLRTPEDIGLPSPPEQVDQVRVDRLRALIRERVEPDIDPAQLEDDARTQLLALAERKLAEGRDVIELPSPEPSDEAEVIDLMDVLKRSLSHPGSGASGASETANP